MLKKLVRDGYIKLPSRPGTSFRKASPEELNELLEQKQVEEMNELNNAISAKDRSSTAEEAADVIEITLERASLIGVTASHVEKARKAKIDKLGGFQKKVVLVRKS